MHKDFKCLDVAAGQVYISRDVVFDETVYLFSKLNPLLLESNVLMILMLMYIPFMYSLILVVLISLMQKIWFVLMKKQVLGKLIQLLVPELKMICIQTRLLIHAAVSIPIQILPLLPKLFFNPMSSIPVLILLPWTELHPGALS
jgi:hypothetical protein